MNNPNNPISAKKNTRVILWIALIVVASLGFYLNRAYAHIYRTIARYDLPSPILDRDFQVHPEVPIGRITMVVLGDSLAAGVGASGEQQTYPYLLAQQFRSRPVRLVNLAISGATAADVRRYQLPELKGIKPDLVVLLIGVNDIHNRTPLLQYQQEILKIVSDPSLSSAKVAVITIPMIGDRSLMLPPYQGYFDWRTRQYNAALRSALRGTSVYILDLYAKQNEFVKNADFYSKDHFHPSDVGYGLWADFIVDALRSYDR